MNQRHAPPAQSGPPPQLLARVTVQFKSGRTLAMEHVYHTIQVAGNAIQHMFQEPRGTHRTWFINPSEMEHLELEPSKVDLG